MCFSYHVYIVFKTTYSISVIELSNFAGTPPTIVFAATFLVTTAPAATMAFSPIVTPGNTVTPAPNHAFCLMTMPLSTNYFL